MNNEEKILAILEQMQGDITSLKQGQAKLEQGQVKLEEGQAKLEQGQAKLEEGQAKLEQDLMETRQDVRALNQRVATVESQVLYELGIIKDGITGWKERNNQIDEMEATQENHENRIFALEQLVRK